MKEIFIIYDKNTGYIDGGTGRIDREWDKKHNDDSTISKRVLQILAKNPNRKVIYLPNGELPNPKRHKVENKKIVDLTHMDKQKIKAAKPKSILDRIVILEKKIAILNQNK